MNVELTRVYHFSAAHRLENRALSLEANAALYGDCHRAHGHNYYLQVTVAGPPHPVTGLAADLVRLRPGREGNPERRHVRRGLRRDGDREGHRLFQRL